MGGTTFPLPARLLYRGFGLLWREQANNAQRITRQQNCCCLRRVLTLQFLPLWAVQVLGFHRDSLIHVLTPQMAVGHFRVISLYMQRKDLINMKQCPGTLVPWVLVR